MHNRATTLRQIAAEYDSAPVASKETVQAYEDLSRWVEVWFNGIRQHLDVVGVDNPEPYTTAQEQANAVAKGRVEVSQQHLSHEVMSDGENWRYRVFHDVIGHANVEGVTAGFTKSGEILAWKIQRQYMLDNGATNAAIAVGFTETLGNFASKLVAGEYPKQIAAVLGSFNASRIVNDI